MTKSKNKRNSVFIATVSLMVALIVVLLVPSTIAWFTDTSGKKADININFGTVAIDVGETIFTADREGLIYYLPGDFINYTYKISNKKNSGQVSTVDQYVAYGYEPIILYAHQDGSGLVEDLYQIPDVSKYFKFNGEGRVETLSSVDFITDNGLTEDDRIFELTAQKSSGIYIENTINVSGNIEISQELPNEVESNGKTYYFNQKPRTIDGKTWGTEENPYPIIKLGVKVKVASIQKDNNTDANGLIGESAIEYLKSKKYGITNGGESEPITTQTGSFSVADGANHKVNNFKIYGKSEQTTTYTRKNLFNINNYMTGTASTGPYIGFDLSNLVIGKTYTLSTKKTLGKLKISTSPTGYNTYQQGTIVGGAVRTFTMARHASIPETSTQYLFLGLDAATWVSDVSELAGYQIQIEEGSVATAYEEYIVYPSPNYPQTIKSFGEYNESTGKYEIDITVSGKNLFETGTVDDYIQQNKGTTALTVTGNTLEGMTNSSASSSIIYKKHRYEPGTYAIQAVFSAGADFLVQCYDSYGNVITTNGIVSGMSATYNSYYQGFYVYPVKDSNNLASVVITVPQSVAYWQFGTVFKRDNGVGTDSRATISNIQIERGDAPTEYEPYNGTTQTIFLNEPLRAIINSKGEVVAQDELNVLTGEVIRKVGEIAFTGSEGFWNYTSTDGVVAITVGNKKLGLDMSICSHFKNTGDSAVTAWNPNSSNYVFTDHNTARNCYFKYKEIDELTLTTGRDREAEFKEWVKEQYEEGTPLTIVYALNTESFTTESVNALYISTIEGTTNISISAGGVDAGKVVFEYFTQAPM